MISFVVGFCTSSVIIGTQQMKKVKPQEQTEEYYPLDINRKAIGWNRETREYIYEGDLEDLSLDTSEIKLPKRVPSTDLEDAVQDLY